jgi:hypothetical protein
MSDTSEHYLVQDYRCACGAQWGTAPFDHAGGKSWRQWWEHHINIEIKENAMPQQIDDLPILNQAHAVVEEEAAVRELINGRIKLYGDPAETFERIAQVWSGILGYPVRACDVSLCLIGMKAVRANVSPDYSDNSDDIEGYLDIFRTSVGEDMIHARTGAEYWAEKARRG